MQPEFLASLGDGTLVAGGEEGGLTVLVGLDPEGEHIFEHVLDPELLGITGGFPHQGLAGLAPRGAEDELLVSLSTGALSMETSTGAINWVLDDEVVTTMGFGSGTVRIGGIATSPSGEIAAYGQSYDDLHGVHVMRIDPTSGTSLWHASRWGDGSDADWPADIAVDDGPFGVLFGVSAHAGSNGCSSFADLDRYDLDTGEAQPSIFSHGTCGGDDDYTRCVAILGDGRVMAVVAHSPNPPNGPRSTHVEHWTPAGELEASNVVPGHYSYSCSAVANPDGGSFVLTRGGTTEGFSPSDPVTDLVLQVSANGDFSVLLDEGPDARADIGLRPSGALAVLRTTSLGNASVRQYCFD
ncbi:MAG: hypothetical protein ACRBN8_43985 [Nannocystales bacterium]